MTETTKRAVVTGASSGIGAATVHALVAAGWSVVALARREDKLKALAEEIGSAVSYVACDITDEDSTQQAVDEIIQGGGVKALVNCAGGAIGKDAVAEASLDDWRNMYELNVIGTLRITQKLLPTLKAAPGGGTVLIVSSTAGIEPYEGGAGYCASKSAERIMARVLRLEQIGQPLRVIDISPGLVKTDEFSVKRFGGDAAKAAAVYQGVPNPLTADDVAESIRWALDQPDTVDIDSIVVRPRAEGSYTKLYRES
ncbi:SDR family oxidoreductase [Bifidobacterium tibiigranuli]|jgi:NADP-dependent 3-hydroxy acid dehydrogenase YdfG|uniref:SDR family oxidoreductase n=1 Tax=Bifidobacterium tibiigranuli TaxID=2172043 RepID=UPI00235785F9|nr:SDR family oxidoreductase [Bifidobacterium tibiigranuli]MCI1210474.1 SDR family oxidoreductase [Bifidobacterium tibiigranuli]MCI1221060.1 SDR family oxidoreductase [Bifidobacterium tibiigranuli]MCI1231881.1 SDR family oxidoreductase [Bifidobacterium tibiigranuli]MCI1672946.1 SDR family oxidoreductase [Bifidobacterium tibiigranuli]MCI1714086.1 SDR family oxidoreductase [Bifidobacterium tibiigranuli]